MAKQKVRVVRISENGDVWKSIIAVGIFFFLVIFSGAVLLLALNEIPLTEQEAQYRLIKTALENDEIVLKGNCHFEMDRLSWSYLSIDSLISHSSPAENVYCEINEIKIGKVK